MASFSFSQWSFISSDWAWSWASSASRVARRSLEASSVSLARATCSISSWRMRRSTMSISVGIESISMRSRLAASSMRSMALSGRRRPVR